MRNAQEFKPHLHSYVPMAFLPDTKLVSHSRSHTPHAVHRPLTAVRPCAWTSVPAGVYLPSQHHRALRHTLNETPLACLLPPQR